MSSTSARGSDNSSGRTRSTRRSVRRPPPPTPPMSVDAYLAAMMAIDPGLDIGRHLDKYPMPSLEKVRQEIDGVFGKIKTALASRCASPTASPDERIVLSVLQRVWPELRLAVDSFLSFAEAARVAEPNPSLGLMRVFLAWALQSSDARILEKLVEFYTEILFASIERARRAASTDVLGFVADLRALLKAARKVQDRWLLPDLRDSPGAAQFLPGIAKELRELVQRIAGEPFGNRAWNKPETAEEPSAGPLGERLEYARRTLEGPIAALSSCCSTVFAGLQKDFPDHPIDTKHRPSTANRDRRILVFWNLGVAVEEIISYEVGMAGGELTNEAVRAAVARARRRRQPCPQESGTGTPPQRSQE